MSSVVITLDYSKMFSLKQEMANIEITMCWCLNKTKLIVAVRTKEVHFSDSSYVPVLYIFLVLFI